MKNEKTYKVEMTEAELKKFQDYIEEQKVESKEVGEYINEEMAGIELKAQIIKALNALDAISQMVEPLQNKTYVKPAFERLIALQDDLA